MRRRLQSEDSVLRGVQVVELGEAEGHDFAITQAFLERVVEVGNEMGSVKVRVNHPEGRGDVLSIVGEANEFRVDGNCVRADVRLFDVPDRDRLVSLAREAGHLFGMSLDFAGELIKKAGKKLKEMTCDRIFAVDFVDTPAATRALFSAGTETNHWRSVCVFSTSTVDWPEQLERAPMTKELLSKLCKRFEIDPKSKDAERQVLARLEDPEPPDAPVPPESPSEDEPTIKDVMASLAGFEKRLTALEAPEDDPDKTELEDEPPVDDEKAEEKMATMAAKVCSIMLAKVGVRPRPSRPADGDPDPDGDKLSPEDIKLAKSLGMGEAEQKQFAANLTAAKHVRM